MAAAPEFHAPDVVDLQRLSIEDLEPVLDEECVSWRSALSWDFSASAELVRRFVRIHALSGYALVLNSRVIGYSYYVCEDKKGLIGDLYILRDFDTADNENLLLASVLESLIASPTVERIETQLMMARGPFERVTAHARFSQVFPRQFMLTNLSEVEDLPPSKDASRFHFHQWDVRRQDDAAAVIAAAYHGHVDARINDQYRSWAGARRFISNIVQYPGCGQFYGPASLAAFDSDGRAAGVILCSSVAAGTGHITQVCVAPAAQGYGIGYELLRRALLVLKENGCEKTSLTVTASNTHAIRLYQRMGFRAVRRFAAYVWEGF